MLFSVFPTPADRVRVRNTRMAMVTRDINSTYRHHRSPPPLPCQGETRLPLARHGVQAGKQITAFSGVLGRERCLPESDLTVESGQGLDEPHRLIPLVRYL